MTVCHIFLEGKPLPSNDESIEIAGAYINCWVNAKDEASAKRKAIKHIHDKEGWQVLNIEEIYIVNHEMYADLPDSLECFNQAVACGIGVIFNTWPTGCEDEKEDPHPLRRLWHTMVKRH